MTPTESATIDHAELERLARQLCESSVEDKGRYDRKGCKRAYWRALAQAGIDRARGLSTLDALVGIFGMKRVKE